MNRAFKFVLVIFGILSLSAVLAPVFFTFLSDYFNFDNIFNRLFMVFTIAAVVLFILIPNMKKGIAFDRDAWLQYGFDFTQNWKRLFIYGFLTGTFFVAIVAVMEVAFGPRTLRSPWIFQDILERFGKGMLSGMMVGIIEEFFFRGFIYGFLRKKLNGFFAVTVASAFYSLCHFFENGKILMPEYPGVWDSLRLFVGYLEPLVMRPGTILNEFIGLFLFGLILNMAYVRTRSLFMSIGIHAGAVFFIKWQHSFFRSGADNEYPFFGKHPYYDGSFEWTATILLGIVVWFLTRKGSVSSH